MADPFLYIDQELAAYRLGREDEAREKHSSIHERLASLDEAVERGQSLLADKTKTEKLLKDAESQIRGWRICSVAWCVVALMIAIMALFLMRCVNQPETTPSWLRPVREVNAQ